jgi:outer membrane protein OmpA-like peptidoglycan-associated protein/tetratricopeptide (TPR) repeat protein
MIPYLKLNIIILSLFLLLSFSLKAQKITPAGKAAYSEAEEYMMEGEYKEALPLYLNLYEKGFKTANLNFKIGECYLNIDGQKDKAIPYLEKAIKNVSPSFSGKNLLEENAPVIAYLYLGIAYRMNYQFDKAREVFTVMFSKVDTSDSHTRMLLENHIKRCNNAEDLIKSPSLVTKNPLPEIINNTFSNSRALLLNDEKTILYMTHLKFYDALMQSVNTDGNWQEPVNLTPLIRSDGDFYITGMAADGKTLLFTAFDPYFSGEIYASSLIDDKWTTITKLNQNINTRFNETHASLSTDGKTLYFTSDRRGGLGGLDLYQSEWIGGDWGPATNLGPVINTIFDEETPFITNDGKRLFFSSQGHYNMGGFDIFCSEKIQDTWQAPKNIGCPVNTPDDDLFYYPIDSGSVAYMSVSNNETRKSDIYRYVFSKSANPSRYTLDGKLDITSDLEINADEVVVAFIEKQHNDTVAIQHLDREGRYMQKLPEGNYLIVFSDKDGIAIDSKEINIPRNFPQEKFIVNANPAEYIQLQALKFPSAKDSVSTIAPATSIDTFYIETILFPFNGSLIPDNSRVFLDAVADFINLNPGILLKINGYADAIGHSEYNLKLSYGRAKAVADYLKKLHVDPSRLSVNGFGESMPVALNISGDGSDCPEGRKYNRRVEIQFSATPQQWIFITKDSVPEEVKVK